MVTVSIVIPTKDDEDVIGDCLASIQELEYPEQERETIIVDGHSTDNTVDIANEYDCRVIYEDGGTISHAREVGTGESRGEYIAFTDADCVLEPDWLNELLAPFESATTDDIAAVGGPNITPDDDTAFARAVGETLEFLSGVGARYGYDGDEPREIHHNPTCNVIYRKPVIKEIDGFDEELVTVDDEELDARIRDRGYRILYTPNARVYHYRRTDWEGYKRMAYRYGMGRAQAIKRRPSMGEWFHVAPSIALLSFLLVLASEVITRRFIVTPVLLGCGIIGTVAMGAELGRRRQVTGIPLYLLLIPTWVLFWAVGFVHGLAK